MKRAILIIGCLLLAGLCRGEIIIVDDYGPADFNNIQDAIDDSSNGDTVYVFPGTYTGPGNRDIDYGGRAITVQSVAPEDPYFVAATVIDCEGLGRGFYFNSGEDANSVLNGLTITNGNADRGGAISSPGARPTIANCMITGNTATFDGGGVHGCSGLIVGCTISDNRAGQNGGGLSECLEVTRCLISNNSAGMKGGGLFALDALPDVSECTFTGNSADNGGAIYNDGGPLIPTNWRILTNGMLSCNTAATNGGAVYLLNCYFTRVEYCTLSGNYAASVGGLYSTVGDVTLVNCVLWGNVDGSGTGEAAQIGGDAAGAIYSCIQDDDPNDASIPFEGECSCNIDDNPIFVRDPNDGGDGWGVGDNDDFGDLHLQSGSPCINAGCRVSEFGLGDPFNPWQQVEVDVDIDGQPRPMGWTVDMGADEFYVAMIAVSKPSPGEVWACGSWHQIKWESSTYEGTVDILLSTNGGGNWQTIDSGVADVGSYGWQVPQAVDSNQCILSVVPSVPDANVVTVESGLFTIHPDAAGPPVVSKWKSLGGDFDRMGRSDHRGPELGCVKWEFEVDGAISGSITVGPNETVYVPCEDGNLYTLDANGSVLWTYEANSPLISAATLGPDGTAYVGSEDGRLYAIDVDGNLRWTHTTDGMVYSSPAVSADGNQVYVCSEDGKLHALGRDGSELWNFETAGFGVVGGAILASPTVADNGTVYVAGLYDSNLYALDPNDGNTNWVCHFDSNGWLFASPVVGPNGTIYQTLLYDPNLYAIDPNNGNVIWATNLAEYWEDPDSSFSASYWFDPYYYESAHGFSRTHCEAQYLEARWDVSDSGWSEPVVGPDGTIYVSFDDPWLRVVEPNGVIKRIIKLGTESGFDLSVGNDGLVYAASNDSNLYVASVDAIEIARFDSNEHWLALPVIPEANTVLISDSRDNSLLISYDNNRLWAISSDGCDGQTIDLYWQGGPQDLNGDRVVNFLDVAVVATDWLKCRACRGDPDYVLCYRSLDHYDTTFAPGDVNRDRYVNFTDIALIAERWLAGY
jgi:predicted outer membrane repeat protein